MKSAFDCAHVKGVSAYVLLHPDRPDELAGRIVCNHSDNPAGSVCTATVHVWAGPLRGMSGATDRAGGYGYCKASAAICGAVRRGLGSPDSHYPDDLKAKCAEVLANDPPRFDGAGISAAEKWFQAYGYRFLRVMGVGS